MRFKYGLLLLGFLLFQNFQVFGMAAAMQKAAEAGKKSDDKKPDDKKSPEKKTEEKPENKKENDKKADDAKHHDTSITGQGSDKPIVTVAEVHSTQASGLDTINVESGGNWLEKRIWFKKAEQLFDEIRTVVKQTTDLRMDFVHETHSVGQKIDDFYEQVNFEKGQVDELLKSIQAEISQASSHRSGDLSSKERSIKQSLQTEQKEIADLGKDIKKIDDFDSQIDKTMMQAFKIVDTTRNLETKAWDSFKAIGTELDDKKARALYYEIENIHKNIEQNVTHLKTVLLPYLKSKLVSPVEQVMTKIKNSMHSLDQKGINLNKILSGEEKKDESVAKDREEEKEKSVEEEWEHKHVQEAEEKAEKKIEQEKDQEEEEEEEEQEKEDDTWYCRLFCSVVGFVRCTFCWGVYYAQRAYEKFAEVSPSTVQLLQDVWTKLVELTCLFICYFKQLFCSVKAWICRLLGHYDF